MPSGSARRRFRRRVLGRQPPDRRRLAGSRRHCFVTKRRLLPVGRGSRTTWAWRSPARSTTRCAFPARMIFRRRVHRRPRCASRSTDPAVAAGRFLRTNGQPRWQPGRPSQTGSTNTLPASASHPHPSIAKRQRGRRGDRHRGAGHDVRAHDLPESGGALWELRVRRPLFGAVRGSRSATDIDRAVSRTAGSCRAQAEAGPGDLGFRQGSGTPRLG